MPDGAQTRRVSETVLAHAAFRPDPAQVNDADLLALLWGHDSETCESHALLQRLGSLRALLTLDDATAACMPGLGERRHLMLQVSLELARRHYLAELVASPALETPHATRAFLLAQLRDRPYEVFCVLHLDNRHRLIAFEELFRGTIDGASVHPREVVRQALARNAAAVILAHNHPSGVAEPSQADELITQRLRDALGLVDIRVLDHLVVGGSRCTSFAERGLL